MFFFGIFFIGTNFSLAQIFFHWHKFFFTGTNFFDFFFGFFFDSSPIFLRFFLRTSVQKFWDVFPNSHDLSYHQANGQRGDGVQDEDFDKNISHFIEMMNSCLADYIYRDIFIALFLSLSKPLYLLLPFWLNINISLGSKINVPITWMVIYKGNFLSWLMRMSSNLTARRLLTLS